MTVYDLTVFVLLPSTASTILPSFNQSINVLLGVDRLSTLTHVSSHPIHSHLSFLFTRSSLSLARPFDLQRVIKIRSINQSALLGTGCKIGGKSTAVLYHITRLYTHYMVHGHNHHVSMLRSMTQS